MGRTLFLPAVLFQMLKKLGSKKPKNFISILGLPAGAIGLADLATSEADTQNTFVSPSHYQKLDDGVHGWVLWAIC